MVEHQEVLSGFRMFKNSANFDLDFASQIAKVRYPSVALPVSTFLSIYSLLVQFLEINFPDRNFLERLRR